jgi:hypothetical protein
MGNNLTPQYHVVHTTWDNVDETKQNIVNLTLHLINEENNIKVIATTKDSDDTTFYAWPSAYVKGSTNPLEPPITPKQRQQCYEYIANLKKHTCYNGCGQFGHWECDCIIIRRILTRIKHMKLLMMPHFY